MITSLALLAELLLLTSIGTESVWSAGDQYATVKGQMIAAPLSFLPVCRPQKIHVFSQKQLRCSCGIRCRYLCENDSLPKATTSSVKSDKTQQQKCKRKCAQRPCYRPAEYFMYKYSLEHGVCMRQEICSYHAKCVGGVRKGVKYYLGKCRKLNIKRKLLKSPIWRRFIRYS